MAARWLGYLLAGAAAWMAFPGAATATHLDGSVIDFEQGDPTGAFDSFCRHPLPCSPNSPPLTTIATSTSTGKYLGTFGEEVVSFFALDALDISALRTDRAYLSFDVILTGAWFGGVFDPEDPDFTNFFAVVANGKTLFDSKVDGTFYPDFRHFDLIFDFTPVFPDCCTDVAIAFSARFGPGYDQQLLPKPTWGIDNFVVSSTPIPEPATGALVGLGLLLLAVRQRRPNSRL